MNISDVKQNNYKSIYLYLHLQHVATKRDIAANLKLSIPTVTKTLIDLVDQGLIQCDTKIENKTGGRNPIAYSYVAHARTAIGMDIARHHIKIVVVDLYGNSIKYVHRRKEYSRTDEYLEMLGSEVESIVREAKLDPTKILGVGIAVPGLVDYDREYVVDGRVIDNTGMTRRDFSQYISHRTKLVHDLDAAGFSEIVKSPSIHNTCYLSLCSSMGASVFINGAAYRGDGLFSGEIGHLNLVPGGRQCYCGKKGCFDPYCNAEVLSSHTGGDLAAFFVKMEAGDEELKKVWEEYLDHVATAVTEIRMMFGCKIIVGGDVGVFVDDYMDALRTRVDAMSPFSEKSEIFLVPCLNKKEAIATGAALYFVQEFFGNLGDEDRE